MQIVGDTIADTHLQAVIVRVTENGNEIVTRAVGESMTGLDANADMHFRNGAVAISYVATLLLLSEDGTVSLDDRLSRWLPDVPQSDRVTLGQLAQMTSGYHDYVLANDAFVDAAYADPFRGLHDRRPARLRGAQAVAVRTGHQLELRPHQLRPTRAGAGEGHRPPMADLLSQRVLQPLGLTDTRASLTAEIPEPALHAFTSERRQELGIPSGTTFYEESTYWNPSWTITHGAIQTATINDLEATAVGIGSGKLLSPESYRRMVATDLRGRTRTQTGCPTCAPMTDRYTYGLGIVISGNWLLQNPMLSGYGAVEAYLPGRGLAIAVAVTFAPEAFDAQGDYTNGAQTLFSRLTFLPTAESRGIPTC
ncbi:hypothetical protein MDOR_23550 [Mycolicibacterium doricum]|uniref:Beta-lactamase-related domain-containing protein n=1 Tax=Mycolicibacterium doricum TaxID=126673 RepID=A0A7I7VSC4_9MYCO|nr:hypothetical protein MDOR_23550 [Mycolicibacterium doricum]